MTDPTPDPAQDLARCAAELAEIAAYEQGPDDKQKAFLGAMWRVDQIKEEAIMRGEGK